MKAYSISSQQEGRGKKTVARFATLGEASAYIQDRWQGMEYKDGNESFHTDASTYDLHGFTFKDIGKLVFDEFGAEFHFNPANVTKKDAYSQEEIRLQEEDAYDAAEYACIGNEERRIELKNDNAAWNRGEVE